MDISKGDEKSDDDEMEVVEAGEGVVELLPSKKTETTTPKAKAKNEDEDDSEEEEVSVVKAMG